MLLTALLTLGALLALLTVSASAADTTFTQGDWEYSLSSGTISVSKYTGSASSVTIPSSVTYDGQTYTIRTVGANCFEDNTKLQSVTIPAQITSIGNCAFKNCTFLSSVTINGDLADCDSSSTSGYYDAGCSVFYNTGTNADSFTVTFGSGVTRIPAYLFATGGDKSENIYAHITSITIPSTVTEIGACAFNRCYDLQTAPIGNGVTSIGEYAFERCTSLKNVTIGTSVKSIGAYAFLDCTALTSIVIPASVTSLGNCAFKNCTFLSSVTINGDLADCDSSSTSGYYDASRSVFYNTGTNADSFTVTFGSGVARIPAYLFATGGDKSENIYAHITSITIPSTVTEIGACAFNRCYDLQTAPIGNGVISIGEYTFEKCTSLKNVTIGTGVKSIGAYAFLDCTALTSIVIPASVTSLGNCAFKNCTFLSSVTINGDLEDCSDRSTSTWYSYGNYSVFYNTGTNVDSFTVTFGSGVSRIPAYLFATGGEKSENTYCHVDTVYIRNATTEIGKSAFYNCYDLTSIHYQGTQSMWNNISGLEDSAIGDGVSIVYENVSFQDVRDNSVYYYTPVYWAYDEGITAGTTATTFSPSQGCTRAQFVTFLWRLAGEPEPTSSANPFTDVTNTSASYYKAVLWAVEQGVTKGTSATTFSPSQTITRAQAVTFLYRYAGEPAVSASSSFTDVTNTSASYYKAVIWAVEKGITNGTTSTTFSPSNPCTRGQMVAFLYRYAVEPLS